MTTKGTRLKLDAIDEEAAEQVPAVAEKLAPVKAAAVRKKTVRAAAAPMARPVRLSVDLGPKLYYWLLEHCMVVAKRMGRSRVPHVEVMRALVAELRSDPELQERVNERIRESLSK